MKLTYCLFISPFFSPNIGGVETHFNDLLNEAKHYNIRYIISTYKPLGFKKKLQYKAREKNHLVYRFPWYGASIYRFLEKASFIEWIYLFFPLLFQSLFLMIKFRRKITVIHSQGFVAGTVGIIIGSLFGKRTVLSDHTVYFYKKNSLTAHAFAYIANQHDVVLAVSELAKKELITWGVKIKKIKPFRYWVNNSLFKPVPKKTARLKLGLKPDVFYVLNVSRLHKAKGLDILVETAEAVYKKDKGIVFLIINADTKDPKTFLGFVGKTSLPPNCQFIGPVDNRKTNIWFNAANLLIVTSKKEGYSRVNIESMLCGTPVIANRVGSLIEVLNERVAVFVNKDNPSEFSRNIVALANNQKKLESLSINALEYARTNFTKQSASRIYKTYKK